MPAMIKLLLGFAIFLSIVIIFELWRLIRNIHIILHGKRYKGMCINQPEDNAEKQMSIMKSLLCLLAGAAGSVGAGASGGGGRYHDYFLVVWKDDNNIEHKKLFAFTPRYDVPFPIGVYMIGDNEKKSNVGIKSILPYLPTLFLAIFVQIVLVFGTIPDYWNYYY